MLSENKTRIKLVEVGPRDGLQNEKTILSTSDKLEYIRLLSLSGLKTIEITSFVKASSIPQMGDAEKLFVEVIKNIDQDKFDLPCLVPNLKGYEVAKSVGVKEISLFSATSNQFTQKNINCSVDESFIRMESVVKQAKADNIKIRGYISTAFSCPYEGEMSVEKLIDVAQRFIELGVYEISIGDTIGHAYPAQVDSYLSKLLKVVPAGKVAMHFHDTKGMALENILVSLKHGITIFDASSGGLGGCPYADGATGNVSTEKVLNLLETEGYQTGVDLAKVQAASKFILAKL